MRVPGAPLPTIAAVSRLQRAVGYTGRVYDPAIDGLIRRLADLPPEVVEDVTAFAELAQRHRGDYW